MVLNEQFQALLGAINGKHEGSINALDKSLMLNAENMKSDLLRLKAK